MAIQARLNRASILRLATANVASAPTDGTTQPHRFMSPRAPTGLRTTGFAIGLKAPTQGATAAVAVAAGFSLVIWALNPVTLSWFACSAFDLPYNAISASFDLNPSGLYYQIAAASVATPGSVDLHFWEQ